MCPQKVSCYLMSTYGQFPAGKIHFGWGSVHVVEFITDFFMVCSSRSFPQNFPEFGFANSIRNFFRAEGTLSTPNVLHTCCSTASHPSFCTIQVHSLYTLTTQTKTYMYHVLNLKQRSNTESYIWSYITSENQHFPLLLLYLIAFLCLFKKKIIQNQTLPFIDFATDLFLTDLKGKVSLIHVLSQWTIGPHSYILAQRSAETANVHTHHGLVNKMF